MSASAEWLGVIGLGRMGGNMATRFLNAGYTVYGEEKSREDAQALVNNGLRWLRHASRGRRDRRRHFHVASRRRCARARRLWPGRHPRRPHRRQGLGGPEHRQSACEPRQSPRAYVRAAPQCSTRRCPAAFHRFKQER